MIAGGSVLYLSALAASLAATIIGNGLVSGLGAQASKQATSSVELVTFWLSIGLVGPMLGWITGLLLQRTALKAEHSSREVPILILTAHTLTDADKVRLNGQILGIVEKGDDGAAGLRRWLARLSLPTVKTGAKPA